MLRISLVICATFSLLVLFFTWLYFQNNLDWLAYTLLVIQMSFLIFATRKHKPMLQLFFASSAFLITLPFLLQSSSSIYFEILQGRPYQMYLITFWAQTFISLSVIFAYSVVERSKAKSTNGAFLYTESSSNSGIGLLTTFILYVVVTFAYYNLGNEWIFETRHDQLFIEKSAAQLFLSFVIKSIPGFIGYVCLTIFISTKRLRYLIGFLAALVAWGIVCNPVNTPRLVSIASLLIIGLPWLLHRNFLSLAIVATPIVVFGLLPATSILRFGLDNFDFNFTRTVLQTGEFSAQIIFNEALGNLQQKQLEWGRMAGSGLLIFLPRSIWPNKNEGTGIDVASDLGYTFTNIGMPPAYDFYLDFGFIGFGIFGLLLGFALAHIDPLLKKSQLGTLGGVMAAVSFVCIPILLRGDLTTAMVQFYALFAGGLFVYLSMFKIRLA